MYAILGRWNLYPDEYDGLAAGVRKVYYDE